MITFLDGLQFKNKHKNESENPGIRIDQMDQATPDWLPLCPFRLF